MLPAEHKGHVETRKWYKIRWKNNPHPELSQWSRIEGKIDLIIDEDLERYRDFVDVIEAVRAETCATGLSLSFGRVTEEQVDGWIVKNKK
jgi:hypothetical protein